MLLICDYAIRYPEAIPLCCTDAHQVAEELIVFFSRMRIPHEIFSDQGTNFMSQLLKKIYRLLHIHPINTIPSTNRRAGGEIQQNIKINVEESSI